MLAVTVFYLGFILLLVILMVLGLVRKNKALFLTSALVLSLIALQWIADLFVHHPML